MPDDEYCQTCGNLMTFRFRCNEIGEEDEAGGYNRFDCPQTAIHNGNIVSKLIKIPA